MQLIAAVSFGASSSSGCSVWWRARGAGLSSDPDSGAKAVYRWDPDRHSSGYLASTQLDKRQRYITESTRCRGISDRANRRSDQEEWIDCRILCVLRTQLVQRPLHSPMSGERKGWERLW